MSYKPFGDDSADHDAFEPFRRKREAVVRFLREQHLSGLSPQEARQAVEAAGFRFRLLDLDAPEPHVLSADMVADRVTATVRAGRVIKAEPH